MRRIFFLLLLGSCAAPERADAKRPNIVILLADDLGWADVSYHGGYVRTPHIDRLAREGVELDRFYVYPVCSPTRAGLMTGRYPIRYGLARSVIPPWRNFAAIRGFPRSCEDSENDENGILRIASRLRRVRFRRTRWRRPFPLSGGDPSSGTERPPRRGAPAP